MKKTNVFLALCICATMAACDNGMNGEATDADTTVTGRDTGAGSGLTYRERDFVDDAIEDNAEQIPWLQQAIERGTDTGLKAQAQRMLDENQQLGSELRAIATRHNIEIDNDDTTGIVYVAIGRGSNWDEEWADEMAEEYRELVREYERAQQYAGDSELKAFIDKALPTLRSHLDMSRSLEERLDR